MVVKKTSLLKQQLPRDLALLAEKAGVDTRNAILITSTDLNLEGHYEDVYLIVEPDRIVTVAPPAKGEPAIRIILRRQDVKEIRTRQGVGGGFLEALVEGIYTEILAYSNAKASLFHKVAAKLKAWSKGERVEFRLEDENDPLICQKCGLPLQFAGDICTRCLDSGMVFFRVLKLMRPYTGKAIMMMLLVLAGIGISLLPAQLTRIVIDDVLTPGQAGILSMPLAVRYLAYLVIALFSIELVRSLIMAVSGRLASFVSNQISYDMRTRLLKHLLTLNVGYYDRYNVGQLVYRVNGDTEQFRGFVNQLVSGFFAQLFTIVAAATVMLSLSWKLTLITLMPAPIVIMAMVFYWKRIYPRWWRVNDANSKLYGALSTILSGIRVVKAFAQERGETRRYDVSSAYYRQSTCHVEYSASIFNSFIYLLFQCGGFLVWYLGGRMVLEKTFTVGGLIAFFQYLWMFYAPLDGLARLTNWLTSFLAASQRTFEILDTNPQVIEKQSPKPLIYRGGGIKFEDVSFGYRRFEPIIKNVTFEIKPGEHIGIVGKSGSGKTSLINLLARFYEVDEGRILLDDMDIRDLSFEDLSHNIGIVLQEPFLFRGTIYENIIYGRSNATPRQVIEAAKAANAHEFIMKQMLGYDTYIGERGAGLSGGERQRISIARALLYDPKILVLDEATSSVDTESELLIQEALARVTKNRTTIAIAHRLSTLKNSDRILVIDGGRVVESGSHEELLQLKGIYHRLVKIQTELTREPTVDSITVQEKMRK